MTSPDRIDLLEDRIDRLETILLEMMKDRGRPVAMEQGVAMRAMPESLQDALPPVDEPAGDPLPAPAAPDASPAIVSEQWLGQRGFLAFGVVAALGAVGYFLLLAFERGWISPGVRCLGGTVIGLLTAAGGWRLFRRGLHRYGAALIGAGVGMIYLAAWAATRLYGFLPTAGGTVTLAALSLLLAVIALLIDVQWLAAAAAVGAVLAPLVLGISEGAGNLFLGYLGTLVLVLGATAIARTWRVTADILAFASVALIGAAGGARAGSLSFVLYGSAVGLLGMLAGQRAGWPEVRLAAFLAGWFSLGAAAALPATANLPLVMAAVLLSLPIWLSGLWGEVPPGGMPTSTATPPEPYATRPPVLLRPVSGEAAYFYSTAVFFTLVLYAALGSTGGGIGLPLVLVGVIYLILGLPGAVPAFGLVGAAALAIGGFRLAPSAAWGHWIFLGQAAGWVLADRLMARKDGRWLGLIPLAGAVTSLVFALMPYRPPEEPAFFGTTGLALWGAVAAMAALAAGPWAGGEGPAGQVRRTLWTGAGLLTLAGVTAEISWYFHHAPLPERTRLLAGGLVVSAWWALFAGALVLLGFRLRARMVRIAGLIVAAAAALKVVFIDLSTLDALYRVGSILCLAAVFLGVSFLYNRREGQIASAEQAVAGH